MSAKSCAHGISPGAATATDSPWFGPARRRRQIDVDATAAAPTAPAAAAAKDGSRAASAMDILACAEEADAAHERH